MLVLIFTNILAIVAFRKEFEKNKNKNVYNQQLNRL